MSNSSRSDEPEVPIDPPVQPADALPKHPAKSAPEVSIYVGQPGPEGSRQAANLDQGYRELKDGQTLWLDDGDYGDFKFDRKFDRGVVIRSKNSLGAKITGRWFFHLGEGHWLYDTTIATPASKLGQQSGAIVFNSRFIATKNKVDAVCGLYGVSNPHPDDCGTSAGPLMPAHDFFIGWNDFVGRIKLRCWVGASTPTPEFRDFAIYNNAFHDPAPGNAGVEFTFNFYVGDTKCYHPDNHCFPNAIIARNVALPGNNRRFLYFKRGVAKVHDNLCLGARGTAFTQRYGFDSQWWGNKDARGGAPSAIFGGGRGPNYPKGGNDIRGNELNGAVDIRCGTSNNGKVRTPACAHGLMVGNIVKGLTTVGKKVQDSHPLDPAEGGKLDHFTLINHNGQVTVIGQYVDMDTCRIAADAGPGDLFVPPVTTVTPDQVGLKG